MITDDPEQDEEVIAVIVAFMRDAERMAELTAVFLDHLRPSLQVDPSGWPPCVFLELGAVLRIYQWETAGIKDAIDNGLPSFEAAFADLALLLQTAPERFVRGEAPLFRRVVSSWWLRCAHPNEPFLDADVVLLHLERRQLLSSVARLLWNLRDIHFDTTIEVECDEQ